VSLRGGSFFEKLLGLGVGGGGLLGESIGLAGTYFLGQGVLCVGRGEKGTDGVGARGWERKGGLEVKNAGPPPRGFVFILEVKLIFFFWLVVWI